MQRAVGNHAIGGVLDSLQGARIRRRCAACAAGGSACPTCSTDASAHAPPGGGPTLDVSRPGDADELEADRLAEAALRGSSPPRVAEGASSIVARRAFGPAAADSGASLSGQLDQLTGRGSPLPDAVRADLEPRFGADFGAVRVHTGSHAASLADRFGAEALSVGSHVVFGEGRWAPGTVRGRALLAHELAHVVQHRARPEPGRVRAKVVDDDEHLPCRATAGRSAAVVAGLETDAIGNAERAATALRARPISEPTRKLLWERLRLDVNDSVDRCRFIPAVADRLTMLANAIKNKEARYKCTATGEPAGRCADEHPYAYTHAALSPKIDLCVAFWAAGAVDRAETLLHEWSHHVLGTRGVADDAAMRFDNPECYASFAYDVGSPGATWDDSPCRKQTAALPALDPKLVGAPCPSNVYASATLALGYLAGLPPAGRHTTLGFGWDLHLPLTRMHEWELTLGPRITAALPKDGERAHHAALVGLRFGLEYRYRPYRFGFQVGPYAEGGAAAFADSTGTTNLNPYAVGGVSAGVNLPLGRREMFQIYVNVGGGAGFDVHDRNTFGLFQTGFGIAFQSQ